MEKNCASSIISKAVDQWPGTFKIVYVKAGSSWVQGCAEKGNHSVEVTIVSKKTELKSNAWVSWLPSIQCKFSYSVQISKLLLAAFLNILKQYLEGLDYHF